jgi:hypothetical protein
MRSSPGGGPLECVAFVSLATLAWAVAGAIVAAPSGFAIWIASIFALTGGIGALLGYGVARLSRSLLARASRAPGTASRAPRTMVAAVLGGAISGAVVLLSFSTLNPPNLWLVEAIAFGTFLMSAAALFVLLWTADARSRRPDVI